MAAVIEKDGKILIAKRKKGDRFEGLWEFPGGKLEPRETPEQCLKRELSEEFGIEAKVEDLFLIHAHVSSVLAIELQAYRVSYVSGEFTLREHEELLWVSLEELANYSFAGPDIAIVTKLRKEASFFP